MELVTWEHKSCPLSGIKKVRSWEVAFVYLVVISIRAIAVVLYREVVL